jgi:MOSC domain-containing protein YiiM
MSIERIFVATAPRAPQIEVPSVRVVVGKGIEGDRHFGKRKVPGENLTLVEAEELEAFAQEQGVPVDLSGSRRNIVTRGVRLNDLVGREFRLGTALLRGVELCEPCSVMGRLYALPDWPGPRTVRQMLHRAGLRADVMQTGVFKVGDALLPAP